MVSAVDSGSHGLGFLLVSVLHRRQGCCLLLGKDQRALAGPAIGCLKSGTALTVGMLSFPMNFLTLTSPVATFGYILQKMMNMNLK